jgi:hypothetical protein
VAAFDGFEPGLVFAGATLLYKPDPGCPDFGLQVFGADGPVSGAAPACGLAELDGRPPDWPPPLGITITVGGGDGLSGILSMIVMMPFSAFAALGASAGDGGRFFFCAFRISWFSQKTRSPSVPSSLSEATRTRAVNALVLFSAARTLST